MSPSTCTRQETRWSGVEPKYGFSLLRRTGNQYRNGQITIHWLLLIAYGDTKALLAGDLEKKMERFVASESPRADLLKVAHHGSATSTTPELLAAVHPRFAVISAGYQNSFGHPRQLVLDRLQAAEVRTYRTDLQGAVT